MAKIDRYNGNVEAFAADSLGTERTIFGDTAQSNTLDGNITADFLRGWGIVGVNENPTKQDFNGLAFTLGQLISYLHQRGVPEWNTDQEYYEGSVVTTLDGIYKLKAGGNGTVDPDTDENVNWEKAPTRSDIVDSVIRVTSIAAIEAYSVPAGYVFSLNAGGRSGVFDVISGDYSTELAADTFNGIYIGLADDPTALVKVAKRRYFEYANVEWFGADAANNDNHARIQSAADIVNYLHFPKRYSGSKALVIGMFSKLKGESTELSGYYNNVCNLETLGSVPAPESDFSDNYNVSADLIVKAPSEDYALYVRLSDIFIGDYGPSRSPRPQYNVFAPRLTRASITNTRFEEASISSFFTAIAFSSTFTNAAIINRNANYCWQFGYDTVDLNAPVSMTSNTFNSVGASASNVTARWYIRSATYSSFNSCYGDGSGTGDSWFLKNPSALTFNGCGSESVNGESIKIVSDLAFSDRSSVVFNGYTDSFGSNWAAGRCVSVDGKCRVSFINAKFLPSSEIPVEIKTTNNARVFISEGISFSGSTSDSTSPVELDEIIATNSNTGSIVLNDGKIFDSNICNFNVDIAYTASVSASNGGGTTQKLYSGLEKNASTVGIIFATSVPVSNFGSTSASGRVFLSPGDTLAFLDNSAAFTYPAGESGASILLTFKSRNSTL